MTTIRIESRTDTIIRDLKNYLKGFGHGAATGVFTVFTLYLLYKVKTEEKETKEESEEEES